MVKKPQEKRLLVKFMSYILTKLSSQFQKYMLLIRSATTPQLTFPTEKVISRFPIEPSNCTAPFASCCTRSPRENLGKEVITVL